MFSKFYAVIANTFVETVRQPIYNILIWAAVFWIGVVNPSMATFSLTIGNDIKVMKDVGLATLLLYGLLASVFSATGVITREIESQTVLTVISKPISRTLFILGKYVGVTLAILVGFYLVTLAFFMAARHGVMETASSKYDGPVLIFSLTALAASLLAAGFANYFYGSNFFATLMKFAVPLETVAMILILVFSPKWKLQPPGTDFGDMQMVAAVFLMFLAVMVLTAFAVALSTRFTQVVTLMLCVGVLLVGLMSDYFFGGHAGGGLVDANVGDNTLYKALYAITPNFQFFWVGDLITQEIDIPLRLVRQVTSYAALYTVAVLGIGVAMFETREVG